MEIESTLSYPFPPFECAVKGNNLSWHTVRPDSGYVFPADSNNVIQLTLNSTNQLAALSDSYFKFKVSAMDKSNPLQVNGAGSAVNSNGLASCIERVRLLVSGVAVDDIENYGGIVMDEAYAYSNEETKRNLVMTEGYHNPDALATGSAWCIHFPLLSLFRINKHAPLPVIPGGGVQLEIYLKPSKQFFTASSNQDGYQVSDFSWNMPMLSPGAKYLDDLKEGVAAGHSLWLPFVQTRTVNHAFSGANESEFTTQVGPSTSIQSITHRFISATDYSDQSKDKNKISKSVGLREFYFRYGSTKLPAARNFQYSNQYPLDFEAQVVQYTSAYGGDWLSKVNITDFTKLDNEDFRIGLNFLQSDEKWGSGLSLLDANAQIRTHVICKDAVPATTRCETMFFRDAMLEINPSLVQVHTVW